jgi:hypothetical protein
VRTPLCDLLGIDVPARSGGEVRVHPYRLRAPFALLPEARRYQIVHRPEGFLVRIVLRQDAPHDFPDKAREAIGTALADADVRVRLEIVKAIEREPGPAAKVRLVRSDVETFLPAGPGTIVVPSWAVPPSRSTRKGRST